MKGSNRLATLAVGGCLLCSSAALAGEEIFNLGEVVVKDKKETITQVGTVDEIDRKTILVTDSLNVADALQTLPGVNFSVNSRNEKVINVRGFEVRQVPVFLDGIPLYVPYDGYVDAGKLPTGNLSQITVSKGISSVLYGANAMGGVINLVSLQPSRPLQGDAEFTAGEHGTVGANVNLGSRWKKFYLTVNGGVLKSDGFGLSDNFLPVAPTAAQKVNLQAKGVRNNSDLKQTDVSTKIGFLPAEGHEYAFGFNQVDNTDGLPPNVYDPDKNARYWRFSEWNKKTYYLLGDSKITDGLSLTTRLFYDTYYNVLNMYTDPTYTVLQKNGHSTYDDYAYGGSLTLRTSYLPYNSVAFAVNYKDDVHRSQADFGAPWQKYETETFSYGLEDTVKLTDRLSFVVGASYDRQQPDFANGSPVRSAASSVNPQGGVLWAPAESLRLHASVAKKTRFPSLKELYSEAMGSNIANPNLGAEKAVNYEVGVETDLGQASSAGLNLFYSDISDLIQNMPTSVVIPGSSPAKNFNQYQNINKAVYKGYELSLKSKYVRHNDLNFNYTYLDAENQSPGATKPPLTDRPKHKIYASDLCTVTPWLGFFASLDWSSSRFDSNLFKVSDFVTVNTKAIVTVAKNVSVEFGVRNLTDKNNELVHGLPTEGRTIFGSLKGAF